MKVLITGASGMLASGIIPVIAGEGHEIVQADKDPRLPGMVALDVTDPEAVTRIMEEENPDYVFHLAAETDVDLCEKEPEHAFAVNTHGTENVARVCKKSGARLLYISTGLVFDGKKTEPYTELDETNPISVYGRSKLEAEAIVEGLFEEYFIFRTAWMIGGWEIDKKFVYKIIQKILN